MNWMARYTEAAPKKLDWHCYFALVASEVERLRQGDECVFSSLAAEQSDFIRFNGGKVRQIGTREDLLERPADEFVREFVEMVS